MTRYTPPHAAFFLTLTVLMVAGCKHHDHRTASSTPVAGGTLTYATDREPVCLDPHVMGDMPQVFVAQQYLDSLVSMDRDGKILPWLAQSWDVSQDGRTYIFHLRHDVTFTDGTPLTAEAVKANFDQIVDPGTQSGTAGGYIKQYIGTEIIDPYTAAVHLSAPYAAFLEVLAQGFLGIESPTALKRPRDVNCQSPVGSGPFKIVAWDRQNEVRLVRNPAYHWAPPTAHHQGAAFLDGITWKFIPEASVRFASLQAGETDVIDMLPPEAEAAAYENPDLYVVTADRPGNPTNATMNTQRAPFSDIRVREAFIRSADIDGALGSVFFHRYPRAGGPLSHTTPFYDPIFEHHADYDPQKAMQLLSQAGWDTRDADGYRTKNGVRLVVHVPMRSSLPASERTLWEQVQATARQTGFDVRLENADDSSILGRERDWDYDLRIGYWNTNTADVLRIIFSTAFAGTPGHSGNHQNVSGLTDPRFDTLVNDALRTQDPNIRRDLYRKAQSFAAADFLQITTYPQSTRLAVSTHAHDVHLESSLDITTLYDTWISR